MSVAPEYDEQTKESVDFSLLRRKMEVVLGRLLKDSQGHKNHSLNTRPMARLFSLEKTVDMVGKSRPTIQKLVQKLQSDMESGVLPEDALPSLDINEKTKRIVGYPFSWIQALRAEAGTLPWRDPRTDDPLVLSVLQFKGGVGKTETTSNLSRFFALKGYRVLVIDMDHQGSCTGSFGFSPDITFSEKDTVIPFIKAEAENLEYAIRKTAWPNIDLIPGCMALEKINWALADYAMNAESQADIRDLYYELRAGIETVYQDYDLVLIDSPPSSSVNSFAIIASTDGMIIPIPPRKHDIASTVQFLGIVERLVQSTVNEEGQQEQGILTGKHFKFVRFLITQFVNEGNRSSNDADFYKICRAVFGDLCYERVFRMMSNIKEATRSFTTVYETQKPNKDVIKELDAVFSQIEIDVLRQWPSKQHILREMGIGG